MKRITDYFTLTCNITGWLCNYINKNPVDKLVVGVSGGIDSAVTSTLCAKTGLEVYAVGMPLKQDPEQESLSDAHLSWLENVYSNVQPVKIDLSESYSKFMSTMGDCNMEFALNPLAKANTKARLRMMTLYQIAGSCNGIVVGTGNKVEDYGVGFFTKYGDGGVDIAPIADLYKSEVRELGREFGLIPEIIDAAPTDGLWDDQRTDEDQLGTSYEMLEWVMESGADEPFFRPDDLSEEQLKAIEQYKKFNKQNQHKMRPIPTYKLGES